MVLIFNSDMLMVGGHDESLSELLHSLHSFVCHQTESPTGGPESKQTERRG